MIKVAISGYFDPIHEGHLDYIEQAFDLGDYLIVFLDSDSRCINKKGFVFMNQETRKRVLESNRYIDEVIIIDTSIADALSKYKVDIFAKGGDRTIDNLPKEEIDICNQRSIKIVCGLGSKIQASSNILKKYKEYILLQEGIKHE